MSTFLCFSEFCRQVHQGDCGGGEGKNPVNAFVCFVLAERISFSLAGNYECTRGEDRV